jgi:hypothetical protein
VDGSVTGEIAMGLLILLGVGRDDTSAEQQAWPRKFQTYAWKIGLCLCSFRKRMTRSFSAERRLQSKPWRISKPRSPRA